MSDDTSRIKILLTDPFIKNLEGIRIGDNDVALTTAERAGVNGLVSDNFGEDLRGRPIRAKFAAIVEQIAERIIAEEGK